MHPEDFIASVGWTKEREKRQAFMYFDAMIEDGVDKEDLSMATWFKEWEEERQGGLNDNANKTNEG